STVTMTLDKPITWNSGNLSLTTGTFTLSTTTSSGTGTLTVGAATTLSGSGCIPTGVVLNMGGSVTATLTANQSIKAVTGSAGTVAVGALTLQLNPLTATSFTYSSVFTGTGTIIQAGAGTQILSGSSTGWTGTWTINS